MNPELFANLFEKLSSAGALDVSITPILMKKNRPANQLNVMCRQENLDEICRVIFKNSTTIGLRINKSDRLILKREFKKIIIDNIEINFKLTYLNNKILNYKPEYEDVKKYSELKNTSLNSAQNELINYFITHI